jgi:hypothetical protein
VLWATAEAGKRLFEAARFLNQDVDASTETWTSWKDNDELVSIAVGHM